MQRLRSLARSAVLVATLSLALAPSAPAELDDGEGMLAPPAGERPTAPPDAAGRRALLETYAPVVLLARGERALPASAEWYLARARLEEPAGGVVVPARLGGRAQPRLRPYPSAVGGSANPADWATYGHVYRALDGGLLLQYWFFYPHNDFHGVGDHDADWEHITVRLGADGEPRGAWYARHDQNAPGVWLSWRALPREGVHPVVLAARGSHASYAHVGAVPWYDEVCATGRPDEATAQGCRVWRTWSGATAGVVDLGSRDAPAVPYLLWPGRWGAEGGVGDDGAGPPGPAFQPGWCSRGAPGCR